MADQDQGTPQEPENLAEQVNEVFEDAGLDADSVEAALDSEADAGEQVSEADSLRAEVAERTEDLQRLSAEFANYRRRVDRDRELEKTQAKVKLINELLPLADDLDRAGEHGDLEEGTALRAFADKFRAVLAAQGAESFGAEGEKFNPEIHEAVQDLSQGEATVVAAVLRKGYRVGERVVRTAMVVIGDAAE